MTTLGIVGLGLIGGSVALAARDAGHAVTAWDADAGTREQATQRGLPVSADLSDAELIVLAVPMADLTHGLAKTLRAVQMSGTATITDVGSLKRPVAEAMRTVGLAERFVGGHPMAGTEQQGFGAANPALFAGKRWALCLDSIDAGNTDLARWWQVASVATSLGAQVVPLLPAEHDDAMAIVSGVPHLLALALAAAAHESGTLVRTLAAGSFADLTRVAASSPALLRAVTEQNEPAVRAALRRLQDLLDRPWAALIESGQEARKALVISAEGVPLPIRRAVVTDAQELLALGRSGAVIEGVDPANAMVLIRDPVPATARRA